MDKELMKMVGIIILNYNNAQLTINCINSVLKFNSAPAKVVIVDNASTDDSKEVLTGYADRCGDKVSFIQAEHNGGYAQGNNIGAKFFEDDEDISELLVLNNDILFIEDIIPKMLEFLSTHPEAGIVSPLLLKKDGQGIDYNCARKDCSLKEIACYYLFYCRDFKGILGRFANERKILLNNPALLDSESVEIELPSGSCMLVNKELFKSIGYFDPNTFLYYEEGILFRKLEKIEKTSYILPGVKCIHLGAQTTSFAHRSYSYLKNSNKSAYYYVMHYRDLGFGGKVGFSVLYALYSTALYLKQHLKF